MNRDAGKPKAIAVVPAYNEEKTVATVVNEIKNSVPDIDVVVIDDGSEDNTFDKAKEAGAFVIRHPFNMGIGATVQTGFKFAVMRGYDIAIQVDGDGQHDPKFIPYMLEIISAGDADVVSGSRFLKKEGFQSSKIRRIGIKIFEHVYRILTGLKITDCTSGFRAFNRKALEFVAKNYPEDYPEPEVIILIHKANFRIKEIPVVMRARQGGKTSIKGLKSLHYMLKVIFALFMHALRKVEK